MAERHGGITGGGPPSPVIAMLREHGACGIVDGRAVPMAEAVSAAQDAESRGSRVVVVVTKGWQEAGEANDAKHTTP